MAIPTLSLTEPQADYLVLTLSTFCRAEIVEAAADGSILVRFGDDDTEEIWVEPDGSLADCPAVRAALPRIPAEEGEL